MIGNSNSNISSTNLNQLVDKFGNANDSQELRSKGQDNIYVKNSSAKIFKNESSRINHQNNAKQEVKAMLTKSGLDETSADKMISSVLSGRDKITVGDVKKMQKQLHETLIKASPHFLEARPNKNAATETPKFWESSSKPGMFGMLVLKDGRPEMTLVDKNEMLEKSGRIVQEQIRLKNTKATILREISNKDTSGIQIIRPKKQEFEIRMNHLKEQMNDFKFTDQLHLAFDEARDRFSNIKTNIATSINPKLNGNQVSIAGQKIGIATQFPSKAQVGVHLREMMDRQAPALAALTTNSEMQKKGLTPYFTKGYSDANIKATSDYEETISLGYTKDKHGQMIKVKADIYNLTIVDKKTKASHQVPVMHVTNWPDMTPVNGNVMAKMGSLMNDWSGDSGNSFIHCNAGVGRTGQVLVGMAAERVDKSVSLEEMVTDMRFSRNANMAQTESQRAAMVDYFESKGRPVLKEDKWTGQDDEGEYIYSTDESEYYY
ncbi:protein-tyrosine phosphatase family protein [Algicola sagamiensis]|uniref:protein-tyrosine phosphatase family protein n=1 Tax=Algicola sagamiensis TaxID=163869 RepID=UPI0003791A41|nr:protein-tyrosine phosphatase family protein [Algicola sagamiensis]